MHKEENEIWCKITTFADESLSQMFKVMADLRVNIGSLELKNPVLTASGTFGYGEEFADFIELDRLGGFIVKGTTLNLREWNPYPRMVETPSGMPLGCKTRGWIISSNISTRA